MTAPESGQSQAPILPKTYERVSFSCLCGASWKWQGEMTAVESAHLRGAWEMNHSGEGHGPTTPRKATAARRRQEAPEWTI